MLVIDDRLTLAALAGAAPDDVRGQQLVTTTLWWWRLSQAAHKEELAGPLSTAINTLSSREREHVRRRIDELPEHLDVLDLRSLLPTASALAARMRLNLLAAEALAAALALGAGIRVAVEGILGPAARDAGVDYAVLKIA